MQQSLIKQGWIRVFIFLVAYLLFLICGGKLLVSFSSSFPEIKTHLTTISIGFNMIAGFILVFFFRRFMDKGRIKGLGLQWKGFTREGSIGLVTGMLLSFIVAVVLWLMQLLQWYIDEISITGLFSSLLLMIAVALVEELVFRGYVLQNLMQSIPHTGALLLSAILFAILHSLNPDFNLTAFFNILLAGLLLGINYIFTRNLWFGILLHFSWNFVQGPVLGFKVSGLELPSLLQQNLRGSILLTGGEFGLEASWLTTIVFGIMIPVLYALFHKKYKVPSA
ncbi:MAG TPA: CPBP family intramembrane glutamic endopeptidase [Lacibacter sp.]|nr:CPBP family intramembrane glutamic endopeptidase [Lacibacter sp.]